MMEHASQVSRVGSEGVDSGNGNGADMGKHGIEGGRGAWAESRVEDYPRDPWGRTRCPCVLPPPQIEDGWWLGKKNGQLGAFPSNFVELLDSGPPSETSTL